MPINNEIRFFLLKTTTNELLLMKNLGIFSNSSLSLYPRRGSATIAEY